MGILTFLDPLSRPTALSGKVNMAEQVDAQQWTTPDVVRFLQRIGLHGIASKFQEHEVTGKFSESQNSDFGTIAGHTVVASRRRGSCNAHSIRAQGVCIVCIGWAHYTDICCMWCHAVSQLLLVGHLQTEVLRVVYRVLAADGHGRARRWTWASPSCRRSASSAHCGRMRAPTLRPWTKTRQARTGPRQRPLRPAAGPHTPRSNLALGAPLSRVCENTLGVQTLSPETDTCPRT